MLRFCNKMSVLAGTFMVILDSTVVNVSLPYIAGNLSATVDEATWVLTTYLAANAIIIPITGWLRIQKTRHPTNLVPALSTRSITKKKIRMSGRSGWGRALDVNESVYTDTSINRSKESW
jgi:MFS family permease